MTLIQLRDKVVNKYGKNSFEAKYVQYVFSHKDTSFFIMVCKGLLSE